MPVLSILIPSVPERSEHLRTLLASLALQVAAEEKGAVEVLALTDFRTMTLGEKRNRMMRIATGGFFIHLDDDDRLTDDAIGTLLPLLRADPTIDVVAFDQNCTLKLEDEVAQFRVRTSIDFENETAHKVDGKWADLKRKPWHWCAWRSDLARQVEFVGRVDEDWQWLQRVLPLVKHQRKLDRVLHEYHFSSSQTLCAEEERPA